MCLRKLRKKRDRNELRQKRERREWDHQYTHVYVFTATVEGEPSKPTAENAMLKCQSNRVSIRCVCVCVCVKVIERERKREKERKRENILFKTLYRKIHVYIYIYIYIYIYTYIYYTRNRLFLEGEQAARPASSWSFLTLDYLNSRIMSVHECSGARFLCE
jgi:hypothetical protein